MSDMSCIERRRMNGGSSRAPPPSPIATGQGVRSAGVNSEILNEYLETSLRIPELLLPEPLIKTDAADFDLPKFDLETLRSGNEARRLKGVFKGIGCFKLVGHGDHASSKILQDLDVASRPLFDMPTETKRALCKSNDRRFGFEYDVGVEKDKGHEIFWVFKKDRNAMDEELKDAWPQGSQDFSVAVWNHWTAMENLAKEIIGIVLDNLEIRRSAAYALSQMMASESSSSSNPLSTSTALCIYSDKGPYRSLSSRTNHPCPHVLGIHQANQKSAFYIYGDSGWSRVNLEPGSVIITAGNILKVWSKGKYKTVIGRPVSVSDKQFVSMEFLYTPSLSLDSSRSFISRSVSAASLTSSHDHYKINMADHFLYILALLLVINIFLRLVMGNES